MLLKIISYWSKLKNDIYGNIIHSLIQLFHEKWNSILQTFKRLVLGFCFKYLYQISINRNKKPNHFMTNFSLQTIWRHLSFFYAIWNWLLNIFQWNLLLIQAKYNSLLSSNNSWLSTNFLSCFKLYWLILRFFIIDYLLRYSTSKRLWNHCGVLCAIWIFRLVELRFLSPKGQNPWKSIVDQATKLWFV